AAERAGAPLLKYGRFINTVIDFLIIALAIFLAVKAINRLKREQPAPAAAPAPESAEVALLREIRDDLRQQAADTRNARP
ncbi:MAG: large conductance mechanosensitive channel protein MscL, partial [Zoogloea sp.]|nr:large conductance mechanosensitive channel protein MscL [Zoogloea sp.]